MSSEFRSLDDFFLWLSREISKELRNGNGEIKQGGLQGDPLMENRRSSSYA